MVSYGTFEEQCFRVVVELPEPRPVNDTISASTKRVFRTCEAGFVLGDNAGVKCVRAARSSINCSRGADPTVPALAFACARLHASMITVEADWALLALNAVVGIVPWFTCLAVAGTFCASATAVPPRAALKARLRRLGSMFVTPFPPLAFNAQKL